MEEIGSDLGRVVAFSLGASWDCSIECIPWIWIRTAVERNGHEGLIGTVIPTVAKTCRVGRFRDALINIGTGKVGIAPVGVCVGNEAASAGESYPPILSGGQAYVDRDGIVNEFPAPSWLDCKGPVNEYPVCLRLEQLPALVLGSVTAQPS